MPSNTCWLVCISRLWVNMYVIIDCRVVHACHVQCRSVACIPGINTSFLHCSFHPQADMKAFFFLFASCLLCTALSASYHVPRYEANHGGGVPQRAWNSMNEDLSTEGVQENDQEAEEDSTLPARIESHRISILGCAPNVNAPFPADDVPSTPSTWKLVGKLDMSDPFQKCPGSLSKISSPRASCGKSTGASCNGFTVPASGVSYKTVCGRFRGYQIASTDCFAELAGQSSIEGPYVDGISITYGAPGKRQHIFTYAVGIMENGPDPHKCPCSGGSEPPAYVGSDYYCESGNTGPSWESRFYHEDPLWDGQQCGGHEGTCCNPPNLGWFCKKFSTAITEDIEVRLCVDQDLQDENVALEFFELYIK